MAKVSGGGQGTNPGWDVFGVKAVFSGYPARCLVLWGQRQHWLARCLHAVAG